MRRACAEVEERARSGARAYWSFWWNKVRAGFLPLLLLLQLLLLPLLLRLLYVFPASASSASIFSASASSASASSASASSASASSASLFSASASSVYGVLSLWFVSSSADVVTHASPPCLFLLLRARPPQVDVLLFGMLSVREAFYYARGAHNFYARALLALSIIPLFYRLFEARTGGVGGMEWANNSGRSTSRARRRRRPRRCRHALSAVVACARVCGAPRARRATRMEHDLTDPTHNSSNVSIVVVARFGSTRRRWCVVCLVSCIEVVLLNKRAGTLIVAIEYISSPTPWAFGSYASLLRPPILMRHIISTSGTSSPRRGSS